MPHADEYASIARLYDHVVAYRERPDIDFFIEAARESGSPVLEIGCGTGRVLIPIARAGIDVVGLDASPAMLSVCRERLGAEPQAVQRRVELLEGDMRAFDLGRTFTLITIPFRPFQHLVTVEDQLACLATIRRHLVPEGRLILDLFNPSLDALAKPATGEEVPEQVGVAEPDGRVVSRFLRIVAHDRANQILHVELIYHVTHPDGREERLVQASPLRYLFRFEAEHLLARAGFEIERLYGGYDRSAFGTTYPGELVFVARKSNSP